MRHYELGGWMSNSIRRLRKQKKMTMQELARRVGTSQQQIDRLEKGHRKLTIEWLDRLTKALECDIYDILPDSFSKRDIQMTMKAKVVGAILDGGKIEWFDEDNEAYHIIFGRMDDLNNPKLFALVVQTDELVEYSRGAELIFADMDSLSMNRQKTMRYVLSRREIGDEKDYHFSQKDQILQTYGACASVVKSICDII